MTSAIHSASHSANLPAGNSRRSNIFLNAGFLWNTVFVLTMVVYAAGLFVDIMEPDAAVYAEISMEMHDRGDFLSIYHKGADWLDKPHFPFWMSALSYHVFGVNTFAYKLPAVLFILLAAFYTFLFARRYYSALHGWVAVLILTTAQHIIISNQDVRAEPFMTGLVIMGLYHFARWLSPGGNFLHAVAGSLALACLMMTKGLFTIIPVAAGIGLTLIYNRNWKMIVSWRWIAVAIMVCLFLSPSLYGYYRQFDMHPEKEVFGQTGVSGVEFFLWTSQWGRFTNTGPIKGKGDLFYFVHTMIWAFLPWAFAAFFALYRKTRALIRGPRRSNSAQIPAAAISRQPGAEHYTYFGFMALFLIFSFSSFQLSFYLNPLFPLLAILTTVALLDSGKKALKTFSVIHLVLCVLLVLALCGLHYFFAGDIPHIDTLIVLLAGMSIGFYIFSRRGIYLKKILFATALVCLSINYYLNRDFYPALLQYQAESQAAHFMKDNDIPADRLVVVGEVQSVADVILHRLTPVLPIDDLDPAAVTGKYVFTSPEGRAKLEALALPYDPVAEFDDFHVTLLTGKFINRRTRQAELGKKYLLKVAEGASDRPRPEVSLWKRIP